MYTRRSDAAWKRARLTPTLAVVGDTRRGQQAHQPQRMIPVLGRDGFGKNVSALEISGTVDYLYVFAVYYLFDATNILIR